MKCSAILLVLLFGFSAHAQKRTAQKFFEEGLEAHAAGKYEEAVALFNECLNQSPSLSKAYVARAGSRLELKDLAGALTDYSIALELQPEDFEARMGRAHVFFKLKRYEEAREDYLRLLTLDAGETNTIYFQKTPSPTGTMPITSAQSAIHPMIYNFLGLTEYHLADYKAAKSWLDSAISLNPREADYFANRALVRQKLGDDHASEDIYRALQINPQHTAALSSLNTIEGGGTASKAHLDKAVESDTTALYPYLERAYQYMQDGDYQNALSDYNAAIRLEPNDPEIWLNRGYVRDKLNDLAGAYDDLTRAISLKEDYAKAWLNRGNVLRKQGNLNAALEDYTVAITYDRSYASAYYNRAVVFEMLKQNKEACNDVRKAESLGQQVDVRLKKLVCE